MMLLWIIELEEQKFHAKGKLVIQKLIKGGKVFQ